jgi:hypothetical protein
MRTFLPGLLGLDLLSQRMDTDQQGALALAVRCHREGGLPRPIAPSTIDELLVEARAWLAAEAEEGRDPSTADVAAAFEFLRGSSREVKQLVPTMPSQT